MKHLALLITFLALGACSSPGEHSPDASDASPARLPTLSSAKLFHPLQLPNEPDNIRHDTLLIYTIHALGDGTFVLAAKHIDETREGLRLVLYRPLPDSSAEVLAVSKPAYDSQVMLPTYFATNDPADGIIILANYGGLESWGQNVFLLKDQQFKDLGWLDVTERGWTTRLDSLQQWRTSIAPSTVVRGAAGQFEFTFTTDSVQLFDDLQDGLEVMLPSEQIKYRYDGTSMVLLVDGQPRYRKEPL